MDTDSREPTPTAPVPSLIEGSPWALPAGAARHDGWTGAAMAAFCETLAETGLVVDACLAAGRSTVGAYALRRRNALFAAAWEGALTIARERLADTLLSRAIEGSVEQYYRDGELVAERRLVDNRLGLAILRRLDRLAETGSPLHSRAQVRANPAAVRPGRSRGIDWELALTALRTGEEEAIREALAMFSRPALNRAEDEELNELNDPLFDPLEDEEDYELDLSDRCWKDDDQSWMTDFPPPAGFTGAESRPYDAGDPDDPEEPYRRACTAQEIAILDAAAAAVRAADRAEDEGLRDEWFALLQSEAADASSCPRTHEPDGTKDLVMPAQPPDP